MNGVHDLGGVDGFGVVEVEPREPVFHERWEGRVFALVAGLTVQRLVHAFRHAIERMEPVHYLGSSYYEHWLTGLATRLVEQGVLSREEIESSTGGAFPLARPVRVEAIEHAATKAGASDASEQGAAPTPRFAAGDAVVVRNVHPLGHTRCPRYVRGKRGIVVRVDGAFSLPDVAAHSDQRCKEMTYSVRFDTATLWGGDAVPGDAVHVDLWESYLEAP